MLLFFFCVKMKRQSVVERSEKTKKHFPGTCSVHRLFSSHDLPVLQENIVLEQNFVPATRRVRFSWVEYVMNEAGPGQIEMKPGFNVSSPTCTTLANCPCYSTEMKQCRVQQFAGCTANIRPMWIHERACPRFGPRATCP